MKVDKGFPHIRFSCKKVVNNKALRNSSESLERMLEKEKESYFDQTILKNPLLCLLCYYIYFGRHSVNPRASNSILAPSSMQDGQNKQLATR